MFNESGKIAKGRPIPVDLFGYSLLSLRSRAIPLLLAVATLFSTFIVSLLRNVTPDSLGSLDQAFSALVMLAFAPKWNTGTLRVAIFLMTTVATIPGCHVVIMWGRGTHIITHIGMFVGVEGREWNFSVWMSLQWEYGRGYGKRRDCWWRAKAVYILPGTLNRHC